MNKTIQPRKQRRARATASLHQKSKFMYSPLSKELRKKYETRSLRVRTGDKVLILRGQFKGKDGLIERVDLSKERVYVKGAELTKKDGGKVSYPIHPSNIRILTVVTEDKKRFNKNKEKKENGQTTP